MAHAHRRAIGGERGCETRLWQLSENRPLVGESRRLVSQASHGQPSQIPASTRLPTGAAITYRGYVLLQLRIIADATMDRRIPAEATPTSINVLRAVLQDVGARSSQPLVYCEISNANTIEPITPTTSTKTAMTSIHVGDQPLAFWGASSSSCVPRSRCSSIGLSVAAKSELFQQEY